MQIDAHQHYWKIARGDYGWIMPEQSKLYRDFLPGDLRPHLAKHKIDGTIVVQAAPTLAETEYLLSLADKDQSILGVVGYLDLHDSACIEQYETFRKHPKYVGFRLMIQEMPDAEEILQPGYVDALRFFEAEDTPIDLLVVSRQLDALVRLLDQVPNLRGVIDHIAKPEIARGSWQPWETQMRTLASYPKLYCKLSGMVTEAHHESWAADQFVPYIRRTIELFGPKRILFGSDWPVCLLAASYDEVVDILVQALPEAWTDTDNQCLFGLNAKEFYKL